MCRHLAWLGAPRSLGDLVLEPAARTARAVLRAAAAAARPDERRRMGRRVLRRPPGRAGPVAVEPAAVGRRVVRFGGAGDLLGAACWPRSARPRPGCRRTRPPPRRSSPGGGCCRTTAWSTAPCSARTRRRSRRATPRCSPRTCSTFGPDRVGEFVTDARRARPGRPAEPAAHRRPADPRHPVGRHAQRAAPPTTASSSRASPTTTTRAGPTSPITTSSTSRADARDHHRTGGMTDAAEQPRPGPARPVPRRAARRRAGRPDRDAEDPAAQVLLRRARQRAVRRDHPAARVLPDPGRDLDPAAARRPRSPRCRGASRWSSSAAAPRPRPGCCCARCWTAGPCASSCRSTSTRPCSPRPATPSPPSTPGCAIAPFVGDFEHDLGAIPRPGPPDDRVPRLDNRQPRARRPGALPGAGRRRAASRATRSCSARTW